MIRDAIKQAQEMARTVLEQTYGGLCTIIEYHDVINEKTKLSNEEEVVVVKDRPCKLSYEKLDAAAQTETAASVSQGIKLFIAPEISVNSGSKVIVTQDGVTNEYSASGEPATYCTHQEIMLKLLRRWA
ncbi:MAG: hypothetical protein K2G55_16815 [Lachnospiraceae bacterium]|nr:hypothetical protein [Lachnospiraceae bacterium]MDE7202423.1 hypothetical protein [Lachnospiraceae bacterium]